MSDLTNDLEKFYKNIDNLKNFLEIGKNSNRFALKYYLEEFEYKVNEFKSNEQLKDLPVLREHKLNELILYQNKIRKLLEDSNISTDNITIDIPIFKNNIANTYFKAIYHIFRIPEIGSLFTITNNEIIDKIFYPRYNTVLDGQSAEVNINPLEKLYFKQNYDSQLLTQLKSNSDSGLEGIIKDIDLFKKITSNIISPKKEMVIDMFYSILVNHIAQKLYNNEHLISDTNGIINKKNYNILFDNNYGFDVIARKIYKHLIQNHNTKSINELFKDYIINTNNADFLKKNQFLKGNYNTNPTVPLNKIFEFRRNELIRAIPTDEAKRKLTKFVLSNYFSYTVQEIENNRSEIIKKYDKLNSVFPSLLVILNNITRIKYNSKTRKLQIYFTNMINHNKNFIYYNIIKLVDRINNFKIDNNLEYVKSFKKLYLIFSLELLRQINNNIVSVMYQISDNRPSNTVILHKLFNNYFRLIVDSSNLDIKKNLIINNDKKNEDTEEDTKEDIKGDIQINVSSINNSTYRNADFIDKMILFTYQKLDRKYIEDDIKEHLKSLFDFQKLFDVLFITINNFDLLARLIKNKRFNFKYNTKLNTFLVVINKFDKDERNMLIETHSSYIDSKYLNSLKHQGILNYNDVKDYENEIIDQKELIFKIQKNILIELMNALINNILNVDKIKSKIEDYVLFINNKISIIYYFALNKKLNINDIYNINNNSISNSKISQIINNIEIIKKIQDILLVFIKEYIFYTSYKSESLNIEFESYILKKLLLSKINLNFNNITDLNRTNQQIYNID